MKQQTLNTSFTLDGKGLHTGAETSVTVHPGEVNTGFVLRAGEVETSIRPEEADGSRHRTVMAIGNEEVHTMEHLLSSLYGMGVDNAIIEVTGGEVPGLDGSARLFAEQIANVGVVEQDAEAKVFALQKPVAVAFDSSSIMAFPAKNEGLHITYVLDYAESRLAQGTGSFAINYETILEELSSCRTFVMKCHAEKLLAAGLGQGANTENTLVLDGNEVVDNELRFDDECVRHKILDVVGDLATVGHRLSMNIVAFKSGHALNLELARAIKKAIHQAEYPKGLMNIMQIENLLPHRYPFLLVDRVLEVDPGKRIVALKNVTRNEEFFQGHFPGQPIMPGVLQIEALAQTGGVLMMIDYRSKGKLAVLMGVDDVKFRRPVVPGDQIIMEVVFEKVKGRIGIVRAQSKVGGEVAIDAKIKFALVDKESYG